jgi:hypothetical protein
MWFVPRYLWQYNPETGQWTLDKPNPNYETAILRQNVYTEVLRLEHYIQYHQYLVTRATYETRNERFHDESNNIPVGEIPCLITDLCPVYVNNIEIDVGENSIFGHNYSNYRGRRDISWDRNPNYIQRGALSKVDLLRRNYRQLWYLFLLHSWNHGKSFYEFCFEREQATQRKKKLQVQAIRRCNKRLRYKLKYRTRNPLKKHQHLYIKMLQHW